MFSLCHLQLPQELPTPGFLGDAWRCLLLATLWQKGQMPLRSVGGQLGAQSQQHSTRAFSNHESEWHAAEVHPARRRALHAKFHSLASNFLCNHKNWVLSNNKQHTRGLVGVTPSTDCRRMGFCVVLCFAWIGAAFPRLGLAMGLLLRRFAK